MTLQNIGLYILPSMIAVLTAYLAHKRSVSAHKDTTVIDRQKLANETYELVLGEVREELARRSKQYQEERADWIRREEELLGEIRNLKERIKQLEEDMRDYKNSERRLEKKQERHLKDQSRHAERRDPWGNPVD